MARKRLDWFGLTITVILIVVGIGLSGWAIFAAGAKGSDDETDPRSS